METIKIRGIKRIVLPASMKAAAANAGITIQAETKRKRKKISRRNRLMEKIVRRVARAERSVFDQYLARHDRSNRKKRNGWLKDFSENASRATRKGSKSFKLSTLF